MPNAIMTGHDDLKVVIPAGSITAIVAQVDPSNPNAKSMITTTVQGCSLYLLKDPAAVVFEQVQKASDDAREWLELDSLNDDKAYINPAAPFAVEQVRFQGELATKLHYHRHDGGETWTTVAASEFERLVDRLNPPSPAPEATKTKAAAK